MKNLIMLNIYILDTYVVNQIIFANHKLKIIATKVSKGSFDCLLWFFQLYFIRVIALFVDILQIFIGCAVVHQFAVYSFLMYFIFTKYKN